MVEHETNCTLQLGFVAPMGITQVPLATVSAPTVGVPVQIKSLALK